jgi:putative resolvase
VLSDPDARVIVVEHRDRLVRFGVDHLEAALSGQGGRIVIADPGERTDDLVGDVVDVLTSMCARPYGRRGARNGAMRAITATRRDPGEAP